MEVLTVRNVNEAFYRGMLLMTDYAWRNEDSAHVVRNAEVIAYPTPVTTVYLRPEERVLFLAARDANPFFHYIESLWILAGQRSVWPLKFFVNRIEQYSDDGLTFHGAYGERLRKWGWGMDQLERAIAMLCESPTTRRAVLQIWNPAKDLATSSKDIPCNDMVFLSVDTAQAALNITVANRSNDMIWGCYGANAVQFSVLQEYLAAHLALRVGTYYQVSNNYHVYTDNPVWKKYYERELYVEYREDHYLNEQIKPVPMFGGIQDVKAFDREVGKLFEYDVFGNLIPWNFQHEACRNAVRMIQAYREFKVRNYDGALRIVSTLTFPDWNFACTEWLIRRSK